MRLGVERWRPVALISSSLLLLAVPACCVGQADTTGSSIGEKTEGRKRCCLRTIGGLAVVGASAAYVALDQAWYAQYDRSAFHGFNDGHEWLLLDKTGHIFSTYTLGEWGHAVLRHCGASARTARWAGGSIGLLFLTGVEVLDGTSSGWGFSGWDMAANTMGAGLFIGQDIAWGEQRMRLKFSSHLTDYAAMRPDLLGTGTAERILKDYNGLALWLSGNLGSLVRTERVPQWLNIAVGYGGEGLITAVPEDSEAILGVTPYRQFYLSPDIDLTRIRTRSRTLRTLLFVLNTIKVPAPALEFQSTGKVVGHWLYF